MNALSTFWRGPAPRRTMKYQREADLAWAREVAARPGCEGLFSCQQCGTCSATCPVSMYMDLGPRQIIALVREGFRDEALRSQTMWLCASCYSCDVECPSHVRLTDLMGSLQREALGRKTYPRRFPVHLLATELCQVAGRRGGGARFGLHFLNRIRTGWRRFRESGFSGSRSQPAGRGFTSHLLPVTMGFSKRTRGL